MLKKAFQIALVILIFAFLIGSVAANWRELQQYQWRVNVPLLLLSSLVMLANYVVFIGIWRLTVVALGGRLGFVDAFRIWFVASLARYLPGKVWHPLGVMVLAEREGVPKMLTTLSIVLTTVLVVLTGSGATVLAIVLVLPQFRFQSYALLAIIAAGLVAVHPRLLNLAVGVAFRVLRRPVVRFEISYPAILGLAALHCTLWGISAVAFYLFIVTFHPLPWAMLPVITGIYAAAYVLSFLSFLTPSGLGVREGILAYLLGLYIPLSVATVVSLASRLWITAVELVCAALGLGLQRLLAARERPAEDGELSCQV